MEIYTIKGLNEAAQRIYEANKTKGFWDKERNVGEMLMLVTSELGEAMEAHRKDRRSDTINLSKYLKREANTGELISSGDYKIIFETLQKDTFQDEIADSIVRLLDLCGGLGIDIELHIAAKLRYNETRDRLHGKKY